MPQPPQPTPPRCPPCSLLRSHQIDIIGWGPADATSAGGGDAQHPYLRKPLNVHGLLEGGLKCAYQARHGFPRKAVPRIGGPSPTDGPPLLAACVGQGAFGQVFVGAWGEGLEWAGPGLPAC